MIRLCYLQRLEEYICALDDLGKTSGQNLMSIIDKEKSFKKADWHDVYELCEFILTDLKRVLEFLEKRNCINVMWIWKFAHPGSPTKPGWKICCF